MTIFTPPLTALKLNLTTDGLRVAEVRRKIIDYLRTTGSPDGDFDAAELVVGELLANVVRHAPGAFSVSLGFEDGYARLEIRDRGAGFSLPSGSTRPLDTRGHGLRLVQQLACDVSVQHTASAGTSVRVTLPVPEKR